jgi:hypothetical protein
MFPNSEGECRQLPAHMTFVSLWPKANENSSHPPVEPYLAGCG